MDEYAKGKYLQHPSPFLGYASWWRVKYKATKGYAWNLNYVVSGAFNADRKKATVFHLECVSGSSTQLQLQRNLTEKMCGGNVNEHWQRGEQAQCTQIWPAWLLSSRNDWVWLFFQGVLHTGSSWLMVLPGSCMLYNCFSCNATKRNCKAIGKFSARMTGTSSLGGFAIESLWYKTTTIHSSPVMNYLVAVMLIRMWREQCAWKKQQCLKKLLYGFILLPMIGGWKIGISLGGELCSSSVCKIHIKCRSGLQLCITAVRRVISAIPGLALLLVL